MIRTAQIADLHFSNNRLDEKVRCFEEALSYIRKANVDIITVCGDVFDHTVRLEDAGAKQAVRLMGLLADIAPVIVLRGNWSHDRSSVEILKHVRGRHEIHVSTDPEVIVFRDGDLPGDSPRLIPMPLQAAAGINRIPAKGVFFSMPYPGSSFLADKCNHGPSAEELRVSVSQAITDVVRGFSAVKLDPETPRILLYHGTIHGAQISESQHLMSLDIELTVGDLEACGFDLVSAGHIHMAQKLGSNIFYSGGLTYNSYGEHGDKGVWIHEIKNRQRQSDFFKFSATRMLVFDVDMTDEAFLFLQPPEWSSEVMDVLVRLKIWENELESTNGLDIKPLFPNAKSVTVRREIVRRESVRCEEVRAAHRLVDKIRAYCQFAGIDAPASLMKKAEQLEAVEDVLPMVKREVLEVADAEQVNA